MKVGQIIRDARIARGLTQEELAEMVGVQKSAVAKWENGRVSEIKRSNLAKVASALGLSPLALLDTQTYAEIKENPEEAAIRVADILLDEDAISMVNLYISMDAKKRKQAFEFIQFLSANN